MSPEVVSREINTFGSSIDLKVFFLFAIGDLPGTSLLDDENYYAEH